MRVRCSPNEAIVSIAQSIWTSVAHRSEYSVRFGICTFGRRPLGRTLMGRPGCSTGCDCLEDSGGATTPIAKALIASSTCGRPKKKSRPKNNRKSYWGCVRVRYPTIRFVVLSFNGGICAWAICVCIVATMAAHPSWSRLVPSHLSEPWHLVQFCSSAAGPCLMISARVNGASCAAGGGACCDASWTADTEPAVDAEDFSAIATAAQPTAINAMDAIATRCLISALTP